MHDLANNGVDLFPLKLNWLLRLPWQGERSLPDLLHRFNTQSLGAFEPITLVKRAIPASVPMKVTGVLTCHSLSQTL